MNREALRGAGEETLDLLARGLPPAEWCKLLRGPLEEAAGQGKKKLVRQLLSSGAEFGEAFDKASQAYEWETVNVLLNHLLARSNDGGSVDTHGDTGVALEVFPSTLVANGALTETLTRAASKGENRVIKRLLEAGAGERVGYALHEAVGHRHFHAARLIVNDRRGISALNTFSQTGRAPLHIAAQKGVCATARMLLEKGADVDIKTREKGFDGYTPLDVAISCGKWDVTKVLLENNADANMKCGSAGRTAAHVAAKRGGTFGLRYLTLLIDHGANVNVVDASMRTPMHIAAAGAKNPEHSPEMVSKLAVSGGDVNAKNGKVQTPLHIAVMHLNEHVAARLVSLGADETIEDSRGHLPQELMRQRNPTPDERHARVTQLLLKAPFNRVWLRRRWLVMFRSHFHSGRVSGGGGGGVRPGKGACGVGCAGGGAGTDAGTGASGSGGGDECVERPSTRRRLLPPTGSGGSGGSGSRGGGGSSGSSGSGVVAWVVLCATEGVFREIVTYL